MTTRKKQNEILLNHDSLFRQPICRSRTKGYTEEYHKQFNNKKSLLLQIILTYIGDEASKIINNFDSTISVLPKGESKDKLSISDKGH